MSRKTITITEIHTGVKLFLTASFKGVDKKGDYWVWLDDQEYDYESGTFWYSVGDEIPFPENAVRF